MNSQYFINKFEAIPEEQWCITYLENDEGQKCANGHCGVYHGLTEEGESVRVINDESRALQKVFSRLDFNTLPGISVHTLMEDQGYSSKAATINNGHAVEYQQETPKQRILAALRDIQLLEQQDKAIAQIQEMVNEEKPDDIDAIPPRTKGKLALALATALAFIVNII